MQKCLFVRSFLPSSCKRKLSRFFNWIQYQFTSFHKGQTKLKKNFYILIKLREWENPEILTIGSVRSASNLFKCCRRLVNLIEASAVADHRFIIVCLHQILHTCYDSGDQSNNKFKHNGYKYLVNGTN